VRRAALICVLLGLFAHAAGAEEALRRFPFDQRFVVSYLNGQDFAARSVTLTVRRESGARGIRGTGFAGCNTWFARIDMAEADRFVMTEVGTTRKFCHGERMKTESEFLSILRAVKRWRMEGRMLVVLGDNSTLVLSPTSRTAQVQ
jgi:heat shock protein HslJ